MDDDTLTFEGMAPAGDGRLLVIACGALAREIGSVLKANRLDHIDLQCLPAILHNHPERIVPAVEKAVAKVRDRYTRIFVAYGDCGTGGELARATQAMGVDMLPGAHCYAFFDGVETFAGRAEDEFTAFYLTDFLARQFDAFVWEPLGLDRHPDLLSAYFGHYEKVVYLAQTDDPALTARAEEAAARLGLGFERRRTGMGDLETGLLNFVSAAQTSRR